MFLTMDTGMALNTDITKGVFDRFRSLPLARSAPLAGRIAADVVRQVWSMAIVLGVGMLVGSGSAPTCSACSGPSSWWWRSPWPPPGSRVLVGMVVDEPEKVMMLGFVVAFPLTFISSAFVPV